MKGKRESIKKTSGAIGTGVERKRASFILTERKNREARKSVRAGKNGKKRKDTGENAELSKNGGEILRGRLSGEKNEEKGRYAKKIKPRKTMV